jgi:hypothetical protein
MSASPGDPARSRDVLRHVPPDVRDLLQEPPYRCGRRERVFLLLWFAGYAAPHAAALAAGPGDAVDALWRSAGEPDDQTIERMASDAMVLASIVGHRRVQ